MKKVISVLFFNLAIFLTFEVSCKIKKVRKNLGKSRNEFRVFEPSFSPSKKFSFIMSPYNLLIVRSYPENKKVIELPRVNFVKFDEDEKYLYVEYLPEFKKLGYGSTNIGIYNLTSKEKVFDVKMGSKKYKSNKGWGIQIGWFELQDGIFSYRNIKAPGVQRTFQGVDFYREGEDQDGKHITIIYFKDGSIKICEFAGIMRLEELFEF